MPSSSAMSALVETAVAAKPRQPVRRGRACAGPSSANCEQFHKHHKSNSDTCALFGAVVCRVAVFPCCPLETAEGCVDDKFRRSRVGPARTVRRDRAALQRRRRAAAARLDPDRAHAGAARRAQAVGTAATQDEPVRALGALSGNQAMQMVRAGLEAIYLSGWQVAADANTAGAMYPDQSLYPANTGPELARKINRTLAARRPGRASAKAAPSATGSRRSSPTPRPASAGRSTASRS